MFGASHQHGIVRFAVTCMAAVSLSAAGGVPAAEAHDKVVLATLNSTLENSRGYDSETLDTLRPSDRSKVAGGQTIAFLEEIPGSPVKIGRGIAIIPHPPILVVQVINDFANYKDIMPYARESVVDTQRSGGDVVYYYSEIKPPVVSARYYGLRIVTEQNVDGIPDTFFNSWHLDPETETNLELSSGSWKLVPYGRNGGSTLAFYTVITDPGGRIPDFIKNRATRVAIPGVYEAITERAAQGLESGIYTLPPDEDEVERAIREMVVRTRDLDISYIDNLQSCDRQKLLKGEHLLSMKDMEHAWLKMARVVSVFDAPPERVFQTVTDYDMYESFIPHVSESAVDAARSTGNTVYLHQRLDFDTCLLKDRFFTIKLTERQNADGSNDTYAIEWALDASREHNVIENLGSWKLVPLDQENSRTLVFFTAMVDPGGRSPWFWKNLSTEKALTTLLQAIQRQAEAAPVE